jgi:hypothetical protein
MSEAREHFEVRRRAFGKNLPNDFLLRYGRDYTITAHTYLGPRDEAQACFANATHRAVHDERLTYVEGYVFVFGVPLQHAWLADANDFVIDPTITDNDDGRIAGYFGVPFITGYVCKAVTVNKSYGVLDYFHASKTAPKLYELGLDAGQQWLLKSKMRKVRQRVQDLPGLT